MQWEGLAREMSSEQAHFNVSSVFPTDKNKADVKYERLEAEYKNKYSYIVYYIISISKWMVSSKFECSSFSNLTSRFLKQL